MVRGTRYKPNNLHIRYNPHIVHFVHIHYYPMGPSESVSRRPGGGGVEMSLQWGATAMFKAFWADETGALISAELATVGTVAVLGLTVGLSAAATSVNDELSDMARAFRSMDQSFGFRGFRSDRAFSAGSRYVQPTPDLTFGQPESGDTKHHPGAPPAEPADEAEVETSATPARSKVRLPAGEAGLEV